MMNTLKTKKKNAIKSQTKYRIKKANEYIEWI